MSEARSQVATLLALMQELEGVMQAENGLLREMKLARLEELQAEKSSLAQNYELELRRLRAEPVRLGGLTSAERVLLETAMRSFQQTARLNAERLQQAQLVAEGVARVLRDSVSGGGQAPAYGMAGRQNGETGRVIAAAFDRRC